MKRILLFLAVGALLIAVLSFFLLWREDKRETSNTLDSPANAATQKKREVPSFPILPAADDLMAARDPVETRQAIPANKADLFHIEGQVNSLAGVVEGAVLTLIQFPKPVDEVRTDASGHYSFELEQSLLTRPFRIQVQAPGFVPQVRFVQDAEEIPELGTNSQLVFPWAEGEKLLRINWILQPSTSLWGRVRWENGAPVGNVVLRIFSEEMRQVSKGTYFSSVASGLGGTTASDYSIPTNIMTDDQGFYSTREVPAKRPLVILAGYKEALPFVMAISPLKAGEENQFDITLKPGSWLSGRAIKPEGKPIEGMMISAIFSNGQDLKQIHSLSRELLPVMNPDTRASMTDSAGSFQFRSLYPGARCEIVIPQGQSPTTEKGNSFPLRPGENRIELVFPAKGDPELRFQ